MGAVDMKRQALNVARMKFLGATVVPVTAGAATLKEAINEAMRDWVTNVRDTFYILGSALGSHPYPMMVRDFHRVIGIEARQQILAREGRLPDLLVACVGGGSNAIGLFHPFLEDEAVKMVGVEAGGEGTLEGQKHAARFFGGRLGVAPGHEDVPAGGRGRADSADALGFRRAGLCGGRSRAQQPARPRPRRLCLRDG